MLTVIYFSIDGRAKVERLHANWRFVQLPDGFHPLNRDSVFRPRNQSHATVFVDQYNDYPLQHDPTLTPSVQAINEENEAYRRFTFRYLPSSRQFWRHLVAGVVWLFRGVYLIGAITILSLTAYGLLKVALS